MGDKKKYPRAEALAVAKELYDLLEPTTERLTIAGSLRRGKNEVGDVELLYIPKFCAGIETDFFKSAPPENHTEKAIERIRQFGIIGQRENIRGSVTWGMQNKLAVHIASGIPVDLFATEASKWNVALVIRTGGKDTNLMLTTTAQSMGRKLHAYGRGIEILSTGEMLLPQSERDVFEMCGCKYLEPRERL